MLNQQNPTSLFLYQGKQVPCYLTEWLSPGPISIRGSQYIFLWGGFPVGLVNQLIWYIMLSFLYFLTKSDDIRNGNHKGSV